MIILKILLAVFAIFVVVGIIIFAHSIATAIDEKDIYGDIENEE